MLVWEVSVDGLGGGGQRAHAELVKVFELSVSTRECDGYVYAVTFLPGSDKLVGNVVFHDWDGRRMYPGAAFWDARSGQELLRIEEAEIVGFSAQGGTFIGKGKDAEGIKLTVYDSASGRALQALRPGRGPGTRRELVAAALSPVGDRLVALISRGHAIVEASLSVEVWSSSAGRRLCSLDLNRGGDVHRWRRDLAFNGSMIAVCHVLPSVLLSVVGRGSECELVLHEGPESCDATHLPTASQLQIAPAWAKVTGLGADSGRVRQVAILRVLDAVLRGGQVQGLFAPDGSSVAISRQQESHLWALGSDVPPRSMCGDSGSWRPVFAEDSAFVAVVCGGREVRLFDAVGGELLRLTPGGLVHLGGVAVSGPRP